jgi:hypothetical protein
MNLSKHRLLQIIREEIATIAAAEPPVPRTLEDIVREETETYLAEVAPPPRPSTNPGRSAASALDTVTGNAPEGSRPAGEAPTPAGFKGEYSIDSKGGYTTYKPGAAPQAERDRLRSGADAESAVADMAFQPGSSTPPGRRDDNSFSKAGEEIEKKGTEGVFTAKADKAGMGVQAYARKVLAKDSKASTKTKRQAAFAKGAATVARENK